MLTRFDDLDRSFAVMDQLRRRMDRLFDDYEPPRAPGRDALRASLTDETRAPGRWPRLSLSDVGSNLVLEADVPGLGEKDVQLSIHQDVLTISGERRPDAPEGYLVHRQERAPVKFARSFTLPCRVDPEKSLATIKNGVLTVTLSKTVEAQPRHITIKAQ